MTWVQKKEGHLTKRLGRKGLVKKARRKKGHHEPRRHNDSSIAELLQYEEGAFGTCKWGIIFKTELVEKDDWEGWEGKRKVF